MATNSSAKGLWIVTFWCTDAVCPCSAHPAACEQFGTKKLFIPTYTNHGPHKLVSIISGHKDTQTLYYSTMCHNCLTMCGGPHLWLRFLLLVSTDLMLLHLWMSEVKVIRHMNVVTLVSNCSHSILICKGIFFLFFFLNISTHLEKGYTNK